jgi:hypothetical protein
VADPLEQRLVGTWSGKQHYSGRVADVTVQFKAEPQLRAHFKVVAPGEGTFGWIAAVTVEGTTVTASYPGDYARIDTLTLGGDTLKGSYTFKGQPWGTVELKKQ